jgi:hypothetical protein
MGIFYVENCIFINFTENIYDFRELMRQLLIILTSIFIAGCNNYETPPQESATPEATNITIGDLHQLCGSRTIDINEDIIIGGYVTSSDKAENFYKSFTIEDATRGAEIMAGVFDTYNIYPIGTYLTIRLNGCSIGEHYGVMQIGLKAAAYSAYPTEYFASQVLLDKHIRRYDITRKIAPKPLEIATLKPSLCGMLVNIGPLRHLRDESATLWDGNENGCWGGYNIFEDRQGERIIVYTSDYADYAKQQIPSLEIAITGILQQGKVDGKEYYMIKMRDEKDCSTVN